MKRLILFLMIASGAVSLQAQTAQGGGLYLQNSQSSNNVVSGNYATGEGTGVYAEGTSTVLNNTIADNTQQGVTFSSKVGDVYENGIVFYVDYRTRTALIVSLSEIPADKKYTYKTYGEMGQDIANATDLNNGKKNTDAMISAQVINRDVDAKRDNLYGTSQTFKIPADTVRRAAHWCTELTEGGRLDWFLPSREQLKKLYTAKDEVNNTLRLINTASDLLGNGYYISSTQASPYEAWYVFFDNGETNAGAKSNVANVRAIREIKF